MDVLVPLVTLTAMEIVLGIDNIVFIAILASRLPVQQQARARNIGLMAAMGTRILLLFSITWVLKLDKPFVYLTDLGIPAGILGVDPANPKSLPPDVALDPHSSAGRALGINGISVKDLILLIGGMFLIWKSVREIHHKIEGQHESAAKVPTSFASVVGQIALMDIIFSLDSVITAVGMVDADKVWVMVVSIILAILVMLKYAGAVSRFVDRHPTIKILALSFLILIGVMLVAEGIGTHFNKGYIYFAMAFSLVVEMLNMKLRPAEAAHANDD
ncbi:Integral membrane protein TerC family protein [Caulifigura coniformis]|uniref:Integral membrane protein TerC family protein n=1 Tax=Caulifigura coniformis TaxID=2527983 RepID=A0A517SI05_9PLAN|nr:TerC family protein [Caulifigura coniformis]QDT55745.1 Integral membrane protein TerC family protein [Caulifigura coniformis]